MIGKAEEDSMEEVERIRIVSEAKRDCEGNFAEVKREIEDRFAELTKHLDRRKNQLLRQAEAVHQQQQSLVQHRKKVFAFNTPPRCYFNPKNFEELKRAIFDAGHLELDGELGCITDLEPCKMSEYTDKDFECFDKQIETEAEARSESAARSWKSKGCFSKIEDEKGWKAASLDLAASGSLDEERRLSSKSEENFQSVETDCSLKPKSDNQSQSIYSDEVRFNSAPGSIGEIVPEKISQVEAKKDVSEGSEAVGEPKDTTSKPEDCPCCIYDDACELNAKTEHKAAAEVAASSPDNCTSSRGETSTRTNAQTTVRLTHSQSLIEKVTNTPQRCSGSPRNSLKEISDHPEQVKQWLEQILLETEIEPSINEVDKIALKKLNLIN